MSDRHPDDEALSAHLDGAEPELRAHLDGCPACRARLEALRRVHALVATPVPPPPERQRSAAVAHALDVDRRGRPHRATGWLAAAAAALVVVVGAAVGLAQLRSNDREVRATAGAAKQADNQLEDTAPAPAVRSLGDLGALEDDAALRAAVQPAAAQAFATRSARGAETLDQTSPAPGTGAAGSAALVCTRAAEALDPGDARVALVATATWLGTPAEVFVFDAAGRPGAARIHVLARRDCHVLLFESLEP
jgi:hypothetical protein